jgi:hypothetical protein
VAQRFLVKPLAKEEEDGENRKRKKKGEVKKKGTKEK